MKASDWRKAYEELADLYFQATGAFAPQPISSTTGKPISTIIVTPERLRQFYEVEGMRLHEIAEVLNCSVSTAHNLIKRAGIETRTAGEYPRSALQKQHIEKMHEWNKGRHHSEETRRKISAALRTENGQICEEFGGYSEHKTGGYIRVYVPWHPYAAANGTVAKHRLVMEQKLGRYLDPYEVVHHINHIKDDNHPDNLVVMTKEEHLRLHNDGKI